MPNELLILARADVDIGSVLGWSLILVVLVVGGFFSITFFRKWLGHDDASPKLGFTLGDLRQMVRNGQMTEEEFERARAQMIAATQRAAERDALRMAEEAKSRGGSPPKVTDIEELRKRAKRNLGESEPPLPPGV